MQDTTNYETSIRYSFMYKSKYEYCSMLLFKFAKKYIRGISHIFGSEKLNVTKWFKDQRTIGERANTNCAQIFNCNTIFNNCIELKKTLS